MFTMVGLLDWMDLKIGYSGFTMARSRLCSKVGLSSGSGVEIDTVPSPSGRGSR